MSIPGPVQVQSLPEPSQATGHRLQNHSITSRLRTTPRYCVTLCRRLIKLGLRRIECALWGLDLPQVLMQVESLPPRRQVRGQSEQQVSGHDGGAGGGGAMPFEQQQQLLPTRFA